ncbi:MAG: lipid-A-disaccharide synthase [Crocinitomicaceae bacterium]|nr:lipid-A-disaccharide synthase [Crocinitomicaceae bacterium]|tara:strand:- start:8004 stop:9125 length:1122 start_codon:yes stop_codon:yes gene_type:complete
MKYYIIAGEASGDLHGSNLIKELNKLDQNAEVRAWGGDLMQSVGATLVKHIRDLAFMGFLEVLLNLGTIFKNITFCKKDVLAFQPDVLILIDYPGFNLRIAEWAHKKGIKVHYYISPQIWAWKQNRGHKIKKYVDKMFVILPFEKEFYKKFDMDVDFVGHPLLDAVEQFQSEKLSFQRFTEQNKLDEKPIIALLPGSRKQEIEVMLPQFLEMVPQFPDYQFVIAGAPAQTPEYYRDVSKESKVRLIFGKTYNLLMHSSAALVSSGTATLETALFRVPEVVCYKGGWISYYLARMLIKVRFISLVNLIVNREIVTELIQGDFNSKRLKKELQAILKDNNRREELMGNYDTLIQKLGGKGASSNAARLITEDLNP